LAQLEPFTVRAVGGKAIGLCHSDELNKILGLKDLVSRTFFQELAVFSDIINGKVERTFAILVGNAVPERVSRKMRDLILAFTRIINE
jgi:hypothetical protein